MKIKELIEVLQILVVYCETGTDDEDVSLTYYKIITGPSDISKISKAHLLRLEELGWEFYELEECWRKIT